MKRDLICPSDLSNEEVESLLKEATSYQDQRHRKTLQDHLIMTLFFENSTRTLSSFETAAKRLGAEVVRLDVTKSSTAKGETIEDTAATLNAMHPHAIVVRHKYAGVPLLLAKHTDCPVINGGDGAHAHPTQALLDLLTIKQHFQGDIKGRRIAIIGDIRNSRVANSNIELLQRFGMEVILVAPPHFLPQSDLRCHHRLEDVLDEVEVIMSLRTQTERHQSPTYASLRDYASTFCITKERIGERKILLLHPGPVNRNIDIDDAMLKDPRCKVLEQVSNGVVIRMATLRYFIEGRLIA